MRLANLAQPPYETTFVGVLKGVADHFGLPWSRAMLFGGSGHAFLANVHVEICPSGPYCWNVEPVLPRLRDLGLERIHLGFFSARSTPAERAAVEEAVRAHLDAGRPCALCNMENQLIAGYDEEGLLTLQPWPKCLDFPPARLSWGTWREMGDEVHVDFVAFRKVEPADLPTIVRGSLRHAVDLHRHPERHSGGAGDAYGAGPRAWANWEAAVQAGHGASHGNWWNGRVWAECRREAAAFLAEIGPWLLRVGTRPATDVAGELAAEYRAMADLLLRVSEKALPAPEKVQALQEVAAREARAIGKVEALLAAG